MQTTLETFDLSVLGDSLPRSLPEEAAERDRNGGGEPLIVKQILANKSQIQKVDSGIHVGDTALFPVRNNQGAVAMLSRRRMPCDPTSTPRNHVKTRGMASQIRNPVMGRQRQGDLWGWLSS